MYEYTGTVIKVIDGDTMDISIDLGFNISFAERFRIYGLDTYETRLIRGTTDADKQIGLGAKDLAKQLLEQKIVRIRTIKDKKGKYGRYLAEIFYTDDNGIERDFSATMKQLGYDKNYRAPYDPFNGEE